MKVTKHTIAAATIEIGDEISTDVRITDLVDSSKNRLPSNLVVVNNTAAEIGIMYIDDDEELAVKAANPTEYEFLPLDTGKSVGLLPSSIQYIIIKKLSGTAAGDLILYPHNFFKKEAN
jgi:hypothetical protein